MRGEEGRVPGLQELQEQCRELGVPGSLLRQYMNDASKLEWLIEAFQKGKLHVQEVQAKMARKPRPVAAAKAGRPTTKAPAAIKKPVARRRTKPQTTKPQVSKQERRVRKPAAAPQTTRKLTSRKAAAPKAKADGISRRNTLEKVDLRKTDGWSPREESLVWYIFEALKQAKGDRDKALEIMLEWEPLDYWVPKKARTGTQRNKEEQMTMLRYRIARTLWDFAIQTKQHETNPGFGSGPTAKNGKTATRRPGRPKAAATEKPKRGRPAKPQATKPTATKRTATRGRKPARAQGRR